MELTIRDKRIIDLAAAKALAALDETLLDTCADQEYRLCLLELGIN